MTVGGRTLPLVMGRRNFTSGVVVSLDLSFPVGGRSDGDRVCGWGRQGREVLPVLDGQVQ